MRTTVTALHHARWRPRLGANLEAGAAFRTLVARLVTGGDRRARAMKVDRGSPPRPGSTRQNGDDTERRGHVYPSAKTRELGILLRLSRELDVCGDLTATVDNPSELIAWASVLAEPTVLAWRAQDSGCRFVHVGADHHRAPVRGHITAVLSCEQHPEFWDALRLEHLEAGRSRQLSVSDLAEAWKAMPITPPDELTTPEPPSPPEAAPPSRPGRGRAAADVDAPHRAAPTTPHANPNPAPRSHPHAKEAS